MKAENERSHYFTHEQILNLLVHNFNQQKKKHTHKNRSKQPRSATLEMLPWKQQSVIVLPHLLHNSQVLLFEHSYRKKRPHRKTQERSLKSAKVLRKKNYLHSYVCPRCIILYIYTVYIRSRRKSFARAEWKDEEASGKKLKKSNPQKLAECSFRLKRLKVIENINFKLIIFKINEKSRKWKTNFENNKKQNGLKNDNE